MGYPAFCLVIGVSCDGCETTLKLTHSSKWAAVLSAHLHGISINHSAAHRRRIALFLQMPTKQCHVLHIGPEQNVKSVANDGDGADCSVQEDISQHPRPR